MRDTKFRVWYGNQMGDNREALRLMWNNTVYDGHKFILMQYTGLKDKNGKEIYEGDVVKYQVLERFKEKNTEEIAVVEYSNVRAGYTPFIYHTIVEDGFYNYEIEDVEVIGNIYETPEIIKKQNA